MSYRENKNEGMYWPTLREYVLPIKGFFEYFDRAKEEGLFFRPEMILRTAVPFTSLGAVHGLELRVLYEVFNSLVN